MPETDLQAVTSGVEAALGSTAETAHSGIPTWGAFSGQRRTSEATTAAAIRKPALHKSRKKFFSA